MVNEEAFSEVLEVYDRFNKRFSASGAISLTQAYQTAALRAEIRSMKTVLGKTIEELPTDLAAAIIVR